MFKAEWTGSYPNLCCGEWHVYKDGVNVSTVIPKGLLCAPMDTYNIYHRWHFNEDWSDEWDSYIEGFKMDEWIELNNSWISKICNTLVEKEELYKAIQAEDWRYGSCGGCI